MINNNIKDMRNIQVQLDMKVPGSPLVQVIKFGGVGKKSAGRVSRNQVFVLCFFWGQIYFNSKIWILQKNGFPPKKLWLTEYSKP